MRFLLKPVSLCAFLLIGASAPAFPPAVEFGPRDETRCGDADPGAESLLAFVLGKSKVREALAEVSISIPETIEYLSSESQSCRDFRRRIVQQRAEFEFRRAARGDPHGWAESWVHEFFLLDGGTAKVVLQSSAAFREQVDPDEPLTTSWPGRAGVVTVFSPEGSVVGVFDGNYGSSRVPEG